MTCETCHEPAAWVFVRVSRLDETYPLPLVVDDTPPLSAACDDHRQPTGQRLVELALAGRGEPWTDLAELRIERWLELSAA
jgi:hypothetical protein